MCCTECLEEELQPEYVAPYHPDTSLFAKPQWTAVRQWQFVLYRVGASVLLTTWVVADFLHEAATFYKDNYAVWFIFATNWSFLILAVSSVLQAMYSVFYLVQESRQGAGRAGDEEEGEGESGRHSRKVRVFHLGPATPFKEPTKPTSPLVMCLWMVYTIAANGAIMVTISYWGFLFVFENSGFLITPMSRLKHTLNSIYIVTDLMLSAVPIRIFHLVYPLTMGAVYTIFNAVYFINEGVGPDGEPYAYYVIDWRNPIQSAFFCSCGFILTSLVQFLLYALYYLRLRIDTRTRSALEEEIPDVKPEEVEGILPEEEKRRSSRASYSSVERVEMGTMPLGE